MLRIGGAPNLTRAVVEGEIICVGHLHLEEYVTSWQGCIKIRCSAGSCCVSIPNGNELEVKGSWDHNN